MKSELDILNFNGHDYMLSASAIPLDDHIFNHILGKTFFLGWFIDLYYKDFFINN